MILLRTPVSAPLVRTSSGDGDSFVVGSVGIFGRWSRRARRSVHAVAGAEEEFGLD